MAVNILSQQIRAEWKSLWNQCFDDKLSAECVASRDYDILFVERGTVIKATRNYKPPSLEEIIESALKIDQPESQGWWLEEVL